MTNIKKDEVEEKKIKAEVGQKNVGSTVKPSSDLYAQVEGVDESGVEIPTEEAVIEAREWTEENRM